MLKAFLAGVRKSGTAADAPESAERRVSFDAEQLKLLVEFFPIGKKLRYIPFCADFGAVAAADAARRIS